MELTQLSPKAHPPVHRAHHSYPIYHSIHIIFKTGTITPSQESATAEIGSVSSVQSLTITEIGITILILDRATVGTSTSTFVWDSTTLDWAHLSLPQIALGPAQEPQPLPGDHLVLKKEHQPSD